LVSGKNETKSANKTLKNQITIFTRPESLSLKPRIGRQISHLLCKMQKFQLFTTSPLKMRACGTGRKFAEYDQRV
jgi:hypothetical protein